MVFWFAGRDRTSKHFRTDPLGLAALFTDEKVAICGTQVMRGQRYFAIKKSTNIFGHMIVAEAILAAAISRGMMSSRAVSNRRIVECK